LLSREVAGKEALCGCSLHFALAAATPHTPHPCPCSRAPPSPPPAARTGAPGCTASAPRSHMSPSTPSTSRVGCVGGWAGAWMGRGCRLLPMFPCSPVSTADRHDGAALRLLVFLRHPSCLHPSFSTHATPHLPAAAETLTADFSHGVVTPNQLRWRPFPIPEDPVDFVRGLFTICGAGW